MKVTLEMHARQPDLQLVKHHSIMQPNRAKQLRLGKLEEVNVSAVKDYARGVNVAPAHALFNREFFKLSHSGLRLRQKLKYRVIKLLCALHVRNMSRMVQHN